MISKKIHYCWFGGNPLPDDALKCIQSWKKYFPDFEIVEWNESNFDIHSCQYIEEAYQCKKWAFVSDFARFKILYENGGVYFDTDVEVIKSFDYILKQGQFMGKEANIDSHDYVVNPGLGLAAEKGDSFCKSVIDYYKRLHFDNDNVVTICEHVTNLLKLHGYKGDNSIEKICGFNLYPQEFFCPKNYYTNELSITPSTHSIHHYSNSWSSTKNNKFHIFETSLMKIFGNEIVGNKIVKVIRNVYCYGIFQLWNKSSGYSIAKIFKKLRISCRNYKFFSTGSCANNKENILAESS